VAKAQRRTAAPIGMCGHGNRIGINARKTGTASNISARVPFTCSNVTLMVLPALELEDTEYAGMIRSRAEAMRAKQNDTTVQILIFEGLDRRHLVA
jgi:hypothetical protein